MAPQTAKGGGGHDTLHGEAGGWTFDLGLEALKAPVLQNGDGYTDYTFGGYTYYYSRERMAATGTLSDGTTSYPVSGIGWFDHQWGDITKAVTKGWDWFALQLDDQREMMLFIVRDSSAPILVGGSYTDAQCLTTSVTDAKVTALGQWKSPRTGCTYPSGWTVEAAGMTFTVLPTIADQEVSSATPKYWEGACLVSGDANGRAYVELNGYCP
jgi:predicted secreted hydrolase